MPTANNTVLEKGFLKTDRTEYKYGDKVEFAFTDDGEFFRGTGILNAPFGNYESLDFSIDNLEIIEGTRYKDLHIYTRDIIQFFITSKFGLRGSPCKTLEEAISILKQERNKKSLNSLLKDCHVENSLGEKLFF